MQLGLRSEIGGPLILIADVVPSDAACLQEVFGSLGSGGTAHVALHHVISAPGTQEVELDAFAGSRDVGVHNAGPRLFSWTLSRATWGNVVGLLEPFARPGCSGFQDLNNGAGPRVVVSTSTSW